MMTAAELLGVVRVTLRGVPVRRTTDGDLDPAVEKRRQKDREKYRRQMRREEVRARKRADAKRYRERNAEREAARVAEWFRANRERRARYMRAYYLERIASRAE